MGERAEGGYGCFATKGIFVIGSNATEQSNRQPGKITSLSCSPASNFCDAGVIV